MTSIKGIAKKSLLIILDGYGINDNENKNAIRDAKKPFLDELFRSYPFTTITSCGVAVGLPKGVMGNSEVGHMNLGAGRPVRQDLVRINEVIDKGEYSSLTGLNELVSVSKKNTKRIHLMGLLSDGSIHSHIDHIKETINALNAHEEIEVFFHAFMDGRDTAPDVGEKYIKELSTIKGFSFASMQGRSIGMDRDRRWEKIKSAYDMFLGKAQVREMSPEDYLKEEYAKGRQDEFISPNLFHKDSAVKEGDCIFFLNFRPDRASQLALAFNDPEFSEFDRDFIPPYFLCMTPYIPDEVKLPILFDKEKVPGGMSEYLSGLDKKQLKIAETEKYPHVTYFFNGGEKKEFKGEKHIVIPSPREVETYDLKPQMSAPEVTDKIIEEMNNQYDFITVNYANSDMVGHTGKYEAAIKAIEALDTCLRKLITHALENEYTIFLTADHGNSDQMVHPDGTPHTAHTKAPVPFCVINEAIKDQKIDVTDGDHALMDVCPTILYSMGIEIPKIYEGKNIFS